MFKLKLKPGNVFQKINKMDRKQAYTWGAIIVVCFVALLTLASFMGDADESSFDGFNTRGYDLAQMPFLNDEAEEYLLASKYPDMQGNNSTMLYSAAEKEARQEEDAAAAEEAAAEEDVSASGMDSADYVPGGYGGSGGGYSGGGASSGPTQIGQLDNASVSHASGSGVNTSWGAPRGDFSPYKSQEKGTEAPFQQLKNQDARRALSQFAQTSRAAAGLRDSKGANAKRALMGGHVQGSEAFTESGVDLSKSGGLALDTNAPVSSADLSNLDDALSDAAQQGKEEKDELTQDMADRLLEQLWSGMINLGMQTMGNLLGKGIDALGGVMSGHSAGRRYNNQVAEDILSKDWSELSADQKDVYLKLTGKTEADMANVTGPLRDDYANYKKGLAGSDTSASEKFTRPSERPSTESETVEIGKTKSSSKGNVDANQAELLEKERIADLKKQDKKWEDQIRKEFTSDLKANRDGSLADTFYNKGWHEVYDAEFTAHTGRTKIDTSNFSTGTTGGKQDIKFKSPSDFTTRTQYETYVNELPVETDVKEVLLKRN